MEDKLKLSDLPKTWIFDLDGTVLKHNGYKLDGRDTLLNGAKAYLDDVPQGDRIIILTSRTERERQMTLDFLQGHEIRFDLILFDMPLGERIIVNDRKPSGLNMAIAVNLNRDEFKMPEIAREL